MALTCLYLHILIHVVIHKIKFPIKSVNRSEKLKMKCTPSTQTDFTFMQSLIFVHQISQSNTLVIILEALLLQLLALINTMVNLWHFIILVMMIIKPLPNVFLPWISSKDWLYISLKSILKRYATMASMPSITSRKRNCISVSLMKRNDIFVRFLIGDIPFFFLLDIILLNVQSVVLLCWCWKFTTKKLHYLNDTEKSWDMDKSISTCAFSIVKQCSHTQNKNFIIKIIAKSPTFALLLFPFLFLIHYTLFFTIWEISYKRTKEKVRERPVYKASRTCGYYSNSIVPGGLEVRS